MGSSCLFVVNKNTNFPNTELLLDEHGFESPCSIEIKKKIMLSIILSHTLWYANLIYQNPHNEIQKTAGLTSGFIS